MSLPHRKYVTMPLLRIGSLNDSLNTNTSNPFIELRTTEIRCTYTSSGTYPIDRQYGTNERRKQEDKGTRSVLWRVFKPGKNHCQYASEDQWSFDGEPEPEGDASAHSRRLELSEPAPSGHRRAEEDTLHERGSGTYVVAFSSSRAVDSDWLLTVPALGPKYPQPSQFSMLDSGMSSTRIMCAIAGKK